MMKKNAMRLASIVLSLSMAVTSVTVCQPKPAIAAGITYVSNPGRVSVHDPSIFKDKDGTYYVFGSHLADAKSTNLINWTLINRDWNFFRNWQSDSIYKGSVGNVLTNLKEPFAWAGYNDGDSKNGINVWAPDVIYNENYEWDNGDKGAYMLYLCTTSTWNRSCIGYAVSKKVTGPYDYVDTIIYSGFTKDGKIDHEDSTRNTKWDNDYLNLKELIEQGKISGISNKWFNGNDWNFNYAPNAIDPTVFYGKDGALYMTYGSWSGGLFILELDEKTGAVKYPGTDSTDSVSGNFTDRYFGTHIAGGNHQSGEGPYILYDAEADYYYLYETYGGLTTTGGYNMRMFRSKNVYGPYVDAAGQNAKDSSSNNDRYGIKLIGNYQFNNQAVYRAAGHNSALIDDNGQRYLIYHQRFENRGEAHEVRVRKQFLNEDNWPVETVYEYRDTDETIEHYNDSDVTGTYEILNHGTSTNAAVIKSQTAILKSDGTVTGDVSGTWSKKADSARGYDYVTLNLGVVTYKGFFLKQYSESSTSSKVMTFSAIGSNNTCLWGSKTSDSTGEEETTSQPDNTNVNTGSSDTEKETTATGSIKKVSLKSVKSTRKKQVTVKWKKVTGAKGYQIQYSEKKTFKKKKTVTVKKASTVKKTIKKLKRGKKYYFRVRAYKTVNGKKVYGKWSSKKSAKIK